MTGQWTTSHPPGSWKRCAAWACLRAGADAGGERLTGGVSSDIWRIDLPAGPICVKRALAKLRVAADWHAPVERNRYEARWMQRANAAVPGAAPALLGHDEASRRAGDAVPAAATTIRCGRPSCATATPIRPSPRRSPTRLARIHAATAADPAVAADFPTDAIFYDIRLEPYLVATAARASRPRAAIDAARRHHAGQQARAGAWRCQPEEHPARTRRPGVPRRRVRLVGRSGLRPRLLPQPPAAEVPVDAVAPPPASSPASTRWPTPTCAGVDWEPPHALEARAARLLPGLFLARVDGKSPVEYITAERGQEPGAAHRARAAGRTRSTGSAMCAMAWTKELAA